VTFTNGGVVSASSGGWTCPTRTAALGTLLAPIGIGIITDFHIDGFSVGGAYNPQGDAAYTGPVAARNFGATATSLDLVLDNPRFIPSPRPWPCWPGPGGPGGALPPELLKASPVLV